MPIVTTTAGSLWNTTAGNKTVTATPAVNDLIIVITASTGVATSAVSDNQSGAYTQVGTTRTGFSTSGNLQMFVRNSFVASAVSTIYTATQTGSTGGGLVVLRLSGASVAGSAAIRSTGGQSTGTAGTTPAPVLSLTPDTGNAIIAAVANGTNSATTVTPRTGYTERHDAGYNTPATGLEVCTLNSGETTATITFGSTTVTAFASYAIEVIATVSTTYEESSNISIDSSDVLNTVELIINSLSSVDSSVDNSSVADLILTTNIDLSSDNIVDIINNIVTNADSGLTIDSNIINIIGLLFDDLSSIDSSSDVASVVQLILDSNIDLSSDSIVSSIGNIIINTTSSLSIVNSIDGIGNIIIEESSTMTSDAESGDSSLLTLVDVINIFSSNIVDSNSNLDASLTSLISSNKNITTSNIALFNDFVLISSLNSLIAAGDVSINGEVLSSLISSSGLFSQNIIEYINSIYVSSSSDLSSISLINYLNYIEVSADSDVLSSINLYLDNFTLISSDSDMYAAVEQADASSYEESIVLNILSKIGSKEQLKTYRIIYGRHNIIIKNI